MAVRQATTVVVLAFSSGMLSGCEIKLPFGMQPICLPTSDIPLLGKFAGNSSDCPEDADAAGAAAAITTTATTTTTTTTTKSPMERMLHMPLNQWPMIYAHDAGTGYFKDDVCKGLASVTNNWAVNQQRGGFKAQLECGARAFDVRPYVSGGKLIFHHGDVHFNHDFSAAMRDITEWLKGEPDEFVLLYINDCGGGGDCSKKSIDAVRAAGIQVLHHNSLASMTLGSAKEKGRLSGGGSALAFVDGIETNYDASIQCYRGGHDCTDGADGHARMKSMYAYLDRTLNGARSNRDNGRLWLAQAHWQYDHGSVFRGTMAGHCIIDNERKVLGAGVNTLVARKIRDGAYPHVNLLGVDNVCHSGPELLQALRDNVPADPQKLYGTFQGLRAAVGLAAHWGPAFGLASALGALGAGGALVARRAVARRRGGSDRDARREQLSLISATDDAA
eukprot:CAMPEP_0179269416 /NCGR_PEP_ID=MMETSP0797-20121207/30946_1 /TAXON_ID=47934 /ORGANISM="Dinophysis acuminata, Strain DAEP01" /LENGTH=446 /DNA_ID=CAMNT_0020977731 /DNA_START=88 /DNA_END=1428 /DNA_ORIENTATION=-